MENKLKIAIIKLSSLGDIVHCAIVLQFIKRFVPDAHISWFVDSKFAKILDFVSSIDEVISLPLKDKNYKQTWQILKAHRGKFDLIIDFQGLIKSAIIARMLGSNTCGFDKNSAKEGLSSIFYFKKFSCNYARNIILRNLELSAFALNFSFEKEDIIHKMPCFSAPAQAIKDLKQELDKKSGEKFILIAPFASEKNKCYSHFNEVIKSLSKHAKCFVIAGNEEEEKTAKELVKGLDAKLLYPLDLGQILALFKLCDLVIGNDSGIAHLAWAQNCATITLFGNRPASRNTYDTLKNISFQATPKHEIDARHIDKSDFCINELEPAQIINCALELIHA